MEEEELIKKLENIKLPEIEVESHRRRLRMALLSIGYLQRQRQVTMLNLAKSKMKGIDIVIRGLVSKQPVWKTAVVSVVALALVIGLSLAVLSPDGQSAYAQAAKIAQNSPQVRAALGGGKVQVVKVIKVVDNRGTVVLRGELGIVTAEVDLKLKKVETVTMPQLTEAEKEKAVAIAEADPRVQEILAQGATVYKVSPMFQFGTRVTETGEVEEFSRALALVSIAFDPSDVHGKHWSVQVDLNEEKVVRIITKEPAETKSGPEGKVEYFQGELKGPVEEPVFHIGKGGIERNTQ